MICNLSSIYILITIIMQINLWIKRRTINLLRSIRNGIIKTNDLVACYILVAYLLYRIYQNYLCTLASSDHRIYLASTSGKSNRTREPSFHFSKLVSLLQTCNGLARDTSKPRSKKSFSLLLNFHVSILSSLDCPSNAA